MARQARQIALTPEESRFRLDRWIEAHMVVISRSGPEWLCVCPRCGREKFAVHVGRKAFQCLSAACRFRGWSPSVLVGAVLDVPVDRAREVIAAHTLGATIGPVPELDDPADRPHRTGPIPLASLPPVTWRLLPDQAAYIRSRGVPDAHAQGLGLGTILRSGADTKADRALAGRVIFPAWDLAGRLVWWVARDITGSSPAKTINLPRSCREADHPPWCVCYHEEWGLPPVPQVATADEAVIGLHWVQRGEPVIVVEGPVDAAVCGPGFVAVCRAWVSPAQAALIAATGASEAVILFDGDRGGEEGLTKALPILSAAMPTRGVICPPGEDPGSIGREAALHIALSAHRSGGVGALRAPARRGIVERPRRRPPLIEPLKR